MAKELMEIGGYIISGEPLVYADSATMTGHGTVSDPFGVKNTDLFVQSPLFTGVSGTSAYIGWISDETVLWSAAVPKESGTITLSENFNNFEKIGVSFCDDGPDLNYKEYPCSSTNQHIVLLGQDCHWEDGTGGWCLYMKWASFSFDSNGTTMSLECAGYNNIYGTNKGTSTASYAWAKPYKIVGINRKV